MATVVALAIFWMVTAGSGSALAASTQVELSPDRGVIRLDSPRSESEMLYRISLQNGKSASIRTSYTVKRVSVGSPEILEVVVLGGHEIQLVSKKIGVTNVLLWDSKGRPQAVIDVEVATAHSQVERVLHDAFGNQSIQVSGAGNAVYVRGSVRSTVVLEQVLTLAQALLSGQDGQDGPVVVNLLEVGGNHQVMLHVVIAEMSKTIDREFGMNYAANIQTGIGPLGLTFGDVGAMAGKAAEIFGSFSSLGALETLKFLLDALDDKGLSKILAKPTLVARSGETASFLVGGEVPIPIGTTFGNTTVEFKAFGVGLTFTPTVLGPNRIHLQVNPEVSRIDNTISFSTATGPIPGFATRRASTSVELADGQSFMIAGLLNDQIREISSKYPGLGDIPILGTLFRSTEFHKEETELVIIVTPVLVKPMGPGQHELPTDHFIEPNAWEFFLLRNMEGSPYSPVGATTSAKFEPHGMIGKIGPRVSTSLDGENL